jgi:hypothetical protein
LTDFTFIRIFIKFEKKSEMDNHLPTPAKTGLAASQQRLGGLKLFFLAMFLMGQLAGSPAQTPDRIAAAYNKQLVRVFEYRDSLEGVHPFVKGLYPIAIAEDGHFFVFDLDETQGQYRLMAHQDIEMKVPKGTRAAFPLDFYDDKCAAVVTGEVFDTPAGYVTIFHEFIHCRQWHTVEAGLRENLPLAQKNAEAGNFMWEITHPFPYDDTWFVQTYSAFLDAAENHDQQAVDKLRRELASILNDDDYQYMVWQEWKEGFALLIENKMRAQLGLPVNMVGRKPPFSRTAFYAGGAAYINFLSAQDETLLTDLKSLFFRMY